MEAPPLQSSLTSEALSPASLARLRRLNAHPLCRHNGARVSLTATPLATAASSGIVKKFHPFNPPRYKRNKKGELKEEKWMSFDAAVTVTHPGGEPFTFKASSIYLTVADGRDSSRKTLSQVRAELHRLTGSDAAADDLATVLAMVKPRKAKPAKEFSAPDPNRKPERLYGHGEPKPMEPVSNEEFMAYLNSNLPENWESLPEIRELPSRTH